MVSWGTGVGVEDWGKTGFLLLLVLPIPFFTFISFLLSDSSCNSVSFCRPGMVVKEKRKDCVGSDTQLGCMDLGGTSRACVVWLSMGTDGGRSGSGWDTGITGRLRDWLC